MNIETLAVGMLDVNCYLVWDQELCTGWIIDPGDDSETIAARVRELGFHPAAILLTHGHVDHIRGVTDVAKAFGIPVWLHTLDHGLYHSPENALMPWVSAAENLPEPTATVPDGMPEFSVLHTPGHTPGCCSFVFPAAGVVFSGDTLFRGSVGRTDFPGGNMDDLLASIHTRLFALPDATTVYAGHGPVTTIGDENGTTRLSVEPRR